MLLVVLLLTVSYLGLLKACIGLRQVVVFTSIMPIPKVAIDEDSGLILAQHYIGIYSDNRRCI